jgi:hypothetical protein
MSVDRFYQPVDRLAYRAIPDDPGNDPLDPSFAALSDNNRWNQHGEPTLYLANDPRVMAAEWSRHVAAEIKDPVVAGHQRPRRIFEIREWILIGADLVQMPCGCHYALTFGGWQAHREEGDPTSPFRFSSTAHRSIDPRKELLAEIAGREPAQFIRSILASKLISSEYLTIANEIVPHLSQRYRRAHLYFSVLFAASF